MSQSSSLAVKEAFPPHLADMRVSRSPGRPINLLLKDTILSAIATVLTEEGYQGLTIGKVAKQAGVSTATVYRRWPTKQAMFFDAIRQWKFSLTPEIDTGSFLGDVDQLIEARIRFLATPLGRTYGTLLGEAVHNPEFGTVLREVSIEPARQQMHRFLERAKKRDEEAFCYPADTVLDVILSTIHFRAMDTLWNKSIETEVNIRDLKALTRCLIGTRQ
ncbi:TetR/AcrR family transcriptional regulator [Gluconobacter cerinus]|mgnify:FL=1|uniref:Histidine kinase n=1 Tax=Gluconobacter cerinus TaxID=38307 RepID=A0A1B6VLG6_9PROT|nr:MULTISPECIES: TetR/AcrR family transcriptional regulator [Gluconobacter]MBM3097941.1 TetR/AcrR family transcriptional regulator [Gluconobacter cerinus]MBS0983226.1 TetR/AcrR family transcriptional regulator [Gluconobacter cerinus]MBS0995262.1 TetR/AcrR family transcriptional regulator [Gluconobacter cerinus]MBS1020609.1 TetR/AcrR family transcriptional regulator [Gluconobacter cerinus]MBS1025158.1 TetR/AcrR family transcriptional regulator [Gluconobacter cerinus]